MLIKCPKCQLIYKLNDDLISDEGLKMHCQHCGEIFKAYPEDSLEEEASKTNQKLDITKMFEHFSSSADNLFTFNVSDENYHTPSKVRVVHHTKYVNTANYFLILILLLVMAAVLYLMRYDLVRYVPNIEKFYQKFNIESIYEGLNLQFTNIKTEEIVVNNVSKIKINGIISNDSIYEMSVLPIKIVIFSSNGEKLLDTTHYLPQKRIGPNYKLPFEVIMTNPTPEKKNIQITFADNL